MSQCLYLCHVLTDAESYRYSMVSTSDYHTQTQGHDASTYDSSYAGPPRRDSNQLLMLPAPLSVSRMTPTTASTSTAALSRSSEEGGYMSDMASSHQRLVPGSQEGYNHSDDYDTFNPYTEHDARTTGNNAIYRQSTSTHYPVDATSPSGYAQAQPVAYTGQQQFPYSPEPEQIPTAPDAAVGRSRSRGVSLADNGPVPGPGGVRRISRQPNRRSTSQAPPQNRYSRGSMPPYNANANQTGY